MLMNNIFQLIDENPDFFKDWGCKINCVNSPGSCKITNPVTR